MRPVVLSQELLAVKGSNAPGPQSSQGVIDCIVGRLALRIQIHQTLVNACLGRSVPASNMCGFELQQIRLPTAALGNEWMNTPVGKLTHHSVSDRYCARNNFTRTPFAQSKTVLRQQQLNGARMHVLPLLSTLYLKSWSSSPLSAACRIIGMRNAMPGGTWSAGTDSRASGCLSSGTWRRPSGSSTIWS